MFFVELMCKGPIDAPTYAATDSYTNRSVRRRSINGMDISGWSVWSNILMTWKIIVKHNTRSITCFRAWRDRPGVLGLGLYPLALNSIQTKLFFCSIRVEYPRIKELLEIYSPSQMNTLLQRTHWNSYNTFISMPDTKPRSRAETVLFRHDRCTTVYKVAWWQKEYIRIIDKLFSTYLVICSGRPSN